jgi:hypothetical protein
MVPILDALHPILSEWKLKTGGEGRVVPPLRCDGVKIDKNTPAAYLRAALTRLGLAREGLGWYEATRHTFASQWCMAGGSIEKLKEILGHYSVVVTERYAHLKPELFTARDLGTLALDLRAGAAEVAPLTADGQGGVETGEVGQRMARRPRTAVTTHRNKRQNAGAAL